jgi:hypothetical protein
LQNLFLIYKTDFQGWEWVGNQTKDITRQLVESIPGKRAKVLLGGGRGSFLPFIDDDK